ncbi:MAG: tRNA (N6-isopentenyl adenosine(37)-C2)-methylthiotransferase MiaB [Spirochaetia bacterium]|jgi:tRNA-2-methylthio-N6-dimethylallyladenosine synthase|nr:tRNA (N6-isopentenyl adenosine(37)-C2)-methylthiotransferase MiaB [Spirochaetia bacterium]
MKYLLETYGCQMNKAESAAVEALLRERSWTPGTVEEANLVLINTCTVRATAENRAWGRIAFFAAEKKKRRFSLALLGCMAEQYHQEIKKRAPAVDYVLGTFQKQDLGLVLDQIEMGSSYDLSQESPAYVFASSHHEPGAFRAFVPIMHGCNNFCSYCIVPYVRGREISRDPEAIMAELDALAAAGVREVTLLGQNVNSYRWKGSQGPLDFPGLLRLIAARLGGEGRSKDSGIGWVRFLTSHPKDLSDELIAVLASEPIYCRHIHLCLQSGSNRVLARMNRKYTREYFFGLVEKLQKAVPGLSFSTDLLVGFPGETEEDLDETLDAMRRVKFSYSFMYHFNPREGTPAMSMDDKVPEKTKKARLAKVIALQKEITESLMNQRIGAVDEILVESLSKRSKMEILGRTARDEMVVLPGETALIGRFMRVRLLSKSGNTFKAEAVNG